MTTCPVCQLSFDPARSPDGLCPRCLLMGGVDDGDQDEETPAAEPSGRDEYQIIELIGRGGMGAIYRAWQPSLGRLVAVKVLPQSSEATVGAARRFENEARVLGLLQHPNIMPVHDMGRDAEGRSFYAMKLVKGRTLQQILNDLRGGEEQAVRQYSLAALLTVFEKICDAMAFAHSQGVLHRDLKPDNIMVGEFGEVLVLDWGLARVSGVDLDPACQTPLDGLAPGMTLDGDVMGTPQFMSPEQAGGRIAEMDERSDVFSLGGVLYAILTLLPPVEGDDAKSVLKRVLEGSITPPAMRSTQAARVETEVVKGSVRPAKNAGSGLPHCPAGRVPASLSAVAMKALQTDLTLRYQTVTALQAEVIAFQRGFATTAEDASAWRLLQLFTLRHKAAAAALMALLVFSVGFVVKLVQSEREAREGTRQATEARNLSQSKSEEARRALARSQTSLAEAAYRAADSNAMQVALNGVPVELRDSDWQYLHVRADNSSHRFDSGLGGAFSGVAADPTRPGIFASVSSRTGDFVFLNAATGQKAGGFPASERQREGRLRCSALAFSHDGQRIISARTNKAGVAIYAVGSGQPVAEWDTPNVEAVDFSADGSRVLEVTLANKLFVRDAKTGTVLWEKESANRGLFLPAGDVVISRRGTVQVLNGRTGEHVRTVIEMDSHVASMVAASDGETLYIGTLDGCVRACGVSDGNVRYEHSLTASGPVQLALSGDGRRLLAGTSLASGGQIIQLLEASSGRTLQTLTGGSGKFDGFGLHPVTDDVLVNGTDMRSWGGADYRLVAGTRDAFYGVSVFWGSADVLLQDDEDEVNILACQTTLDGRQRLLPLPIPPATNDGTWRADAAGDVAVISRWTTGGSPTYAIRRNADSFHLLSTWKARGVVTHVRLSADGRHVAVADTRRSVEVFATESGQRVADCETAALTAIHGIAWIGEKRLAVVATENQTELLTVWDAATGRPLRRVTSPTRFTAVAAVPDGRSFAVGGENQRVQLRNADSLEVMLEFRAHDAGITALAFHPVKPWLATASSDLSVKLWELSKGGLLQEMKPSGAEVKRLSFSPDGMQLACADLRRETVMMQSIKSSPPRTTVAPSFDQQMEKLVSARDWSKLREALDSAGRESPRDDELALQRAVALRHVEDRAAWRAFIDERLAFTVGKQQRQRLNYVAKACALLPGPLTPTQAEAITNLAQRMSEQPHDDRHSSDYSLTIALVHLRCGRFAEAEAVLKASQGQISSAISVSHKSVRALALHALGDHEQAQVHLKAATTLAEQRLGVPGDHLSGSWLNREIAWLLLAEAKETLNGNP